MKLSRWRPVCPDCGYSLRGATSDRCPECGVLIPHSLPSRAQIDVWFPSDGLPATVPIDADLSPIIEALLESARADAVIGTEPVP